MTIVKYSTAPIKTYETENDLDEEDKKVFAKANNDRLRGVARDFVHIDEFQDILIEGNDK